MTFHPSIVSWKCPRFGRAWIRTETMRETY